MSKFIIYGDPHIRYKRPANRKESFYEELKAKLKDIFEFEKAVRPNAVFGLGDLFDNEASNFLSFLMYDLSQYIKGHYSLIGNHDSKKKSLELRGTMLGVLNSHGIIKVPTSDLIIGNVLFRFAHYPIRDEIDHSCEFKGLKVMLAHDTIIPLSEGKDVNYEYKRTSSLETDFDIYFLGHYHFPFTEKVACQGITRMKHNVLFYNPGSILRLTTKEKDYDRIPKIAILEVNEDATFKLKEMDLQSAKDYKEVYDFEEVRKKKDMKDMESKFVNSIKENISNNYDREEVILKHIEEVSKDQEVNAYVSRKIEEWKLSK